MLKLKEDLKNGIYRRAYLLYGDEPYLQNMYKNFLLIYSRRERSG